jgi:hypothetical protein
LPTIIARASLAEMLCHIFLFDKYSMPDSALLSMGLAVARARHPFQPRNQVNYRYFQLEHGSRVVNFISIFDRPQ